MPSYVIALDSIGAGDRYLPEPGASIFLPPNVTVHSTDASAVYGVGAGYTASIEGELIGGFAGLRLASTLTGVGHGVNITETGIVGGVFYGLSVVGTGNMVVNNGLIYSQNYGIYVSGAYSAGNTTSVSTVRNEGRIITEGAGVLHGGGGTTEKLVLVNNGLIDSGGYALDAGAGDGVEHVVNRGTMIGSILFLGGADRYDGIGGNIYGTINGGAGNDTFLPGSGREVIEGDTEIDTLDFRSGGGVGVALDGSFANTGRAAGDVYSGIENVNGSLTGADRITGSSAANVLRGHGGNDTLKGGTGNDSLQGGAQVDRLTGGAGDDAFVFLTLGDCGDAITDFTAADDQIRIDASAFGGGLGPGVLGADQFRARASNLALDADDRFIFRTTDRTLWFDANGSAAGGLTLVADLQASATVTAADIILI